MEMMGTTSAKKLQGLYLVVDATLPEDQLLPIVQQALDGGVDIVQVWGGSRKAEELAGIGEKILSLCKRYEVLCIITDKISVCKEIDADGIHFDGYELPPLTPFAVKEQIGKDKIVGVTCGISLEKLLWAEHNGADYVSFCSIFPSTSVDTCELVPLEMIRTAKKLLSIPVFASGGITAENMNHVLEAGADGIAVVSAILKSPSPKHAAEAFKQKLNKFITA
jgi:thiamine-phosphate pyrophosphorylase